MISYESIHLHNVIAEAKAETNCKHKMVDKSTKESMGKRVFRELSISLTFFAVFIVLLPKFPALDERFIPYVSGLIAFSIFILQEVGTIDFSFRPKTVKIEVRPLEAKERVGYSTTKAYPSIYSQKNFCFSSRELMELLSAWLILSVAFSILYSEADIELFKFVLPICLVTVGMGFLLHELGHKYLAQYYGFDAAFKANYPGLFGAILLSFFGFVLVTPGGVKIHGGNPTNDKYGKISLFGPLMNLLLSIGFLLLFLNPPLDIRFIEVTSWLGYRINAWICLFNLIPSSGFDGQKLKEWNSSIYYLLVLLSVGLYLLAYVL